ncbi:MAG: PSD1 and planctomycete cytochrome C domain-containing protein [Fuerstiella sp.]|nr:PSD1 and planctomycete cytochrome C domain-containing protein [Fuerstiella sp.]
MKYLTSCIPIFCLATAVAEEAPSSEDVAFFETHIRPVLIENCYQCHSNEALNAGKLQGKLLLDSRDAIRLGGDSGPAVVPGDPNSSILISAIKHDSLEMPPKSRLPQEVIDNFVKWVAMGAPDPRNSEIPVQSKPDIDIVAGRTFWSFQPLQHTHTPDVVNTSWTRTEIDRFILAKLEAEEITPNDTADRVTLIRRLYFDIWGLPPERAAVEDFVNNKSSDAYEQLVDDLIGSEHFGERWARHWLDLARFAESNGYAFDNDRKAAFHFRDFIIKAFNEDMPYDKFIRLQVAGDLIAPQDYMAQAATGFLAAGPFTTQQTQKERERSRYEQLDDIVGTLGTSMLGLTIGCARCHDHKFDPVGHHDYYRFTSCFEKTGFQDYDWDPDPTATKAALDAFNVKHQPYIDARADFQQTALLGLLTTWEHDRKQTRSKTTFGHWHHIGPFTAADFKTTFDQKFEPETSINLKQPIGELQWTEKPEWNDATVHNTLTGENAANYLYRTIEVSEATQLDVSFGFDDGIKVFLNQQPVLDQPSMGAVSATQQLITLPLEAGRNELLLKIVNHDGPSGFYFDSEATPPPEKIENILNLPVSKRSDIQQQELLSWFAPRDREWARLDQAEKVHLRNKPQPQYTKVFAARAGGATYNFGEDTRKVYFLARGNSNSKTGRASPAFLRVLMTSEDQEQTWLLSNTDGAEPSTKLPRVALGEWLTDTQHGAGHLLARVIVNRLWQHHFGVGIVATPSDFGRQGARPTHPKLLDYLARKLIEGGWKLKPIHRMMLKSAVYRQSGNPDVAGLKNDPDNYLWWRRQPRRLDAEIIRDNLLAVSGTLDLRMFGAGSLEETDVRRSVYLKMKRGNLIPFLQLFDAPDGMQGIGNRGVTTVPPQALAMMNSPLIREKAEQLAARLAKQSDLIPSKIVHNGFWTTLSRPPLEHETKQMVEFISDQAAMYGDTATAMPTAVADYCQLMLCLNEFIYID